MQKIKVGIFGYTRGSGLVDNFLQLGADIVAVCDKSDKNLQAAKSKLGDTVTCYKEFDEFIEHRGLQAVLLANYFHEHSGYAVRCLEKDIHVLSECLSNSTMAEGVRLVEAAQKSKAKYMLLENYPFMLFNIEMRRIHQGGSLGKCIYAEGEYNHSFPFYSNGDRAMQEVFCRLSDSDKHWRWYAPRTYYVTHSLAPLMLATGAEPIRVTAMPVVLPEPDDCDRVSRVAERAAIITTLNNDGSVFKFTGCASFGAEEISYRLCGEKGMVENLRGTGGKIMLRYDAWQSPEGVEPLKYYQPEWDDPDAELIKQAGHYGGDFCVIREFLKCIREDTEPLFDVYFATRTASVAILGHRSELEYGVPYDLPDFRKAEDRDRWREDELSPFYYSDGREPTMPCTTAPDFAPSQRQLDNFNNILRAIAQG